MSNYVLGSSFVFGYSATGALLGRIVDNVSDRLVRESDLGAGYDGLVAALQLMGGVMLFGELQRVLISERDSELGRTMGLIFFLQAQPGLRRRLHNFLTDVERIVLGESMTDRQPPSGGQCGKCSQSEKHM